MMTKSKWQRVFAVTLVVALLTSTFGTAAFAAEQAVVLQQSAGTELTATVPGGQFAKIYLGLTPKEPGTVTVRAEWDRENPGQNGVGFYVLDEADLTAVVNGGSVQTNNLATGDPSFFQGAPNNVQGAGFRATATGYTIVLYNDSGADGNVKLSVTNALITDDSGNVTFTAGVPTTEATDAEATAAATTVAAATTAATPAAATATPEATTAATPVAVATTTGPVRATTMEGELPGRDSQHYLGLEPDTRDASIRLTLTFDPQDSSELARRLGFWVLTQDGLKRYIEGESPIDLAVAAGTRDSVTGGAVNVRSAAFTASGTEPYTVIVYNNSNIPATYSLVATGGMLVDDSGQTTTAQQAAPVTTDATGVTTGTAPAAATTPAVAAATPDATAGTGVVGQPGGTYTVKAGDTLAIIARDIYGDFRLYEQLCAFNNIADCNVIEIGDVINLPTTAQIGATGTTAAAAATPAATVAAATPAATAAVTTTAATPVTTTTATTATATTTATTAAAATTTTTTTTAAGAGAAAAGSIAQVAANAGNFTILTQALEQTGLDSALGGAGNFTVFAPTDDAFDALLSSNNLTTDQLLRAAELADILRYHVLDERLLAADITNGLSTTTLQGRPVTFEIRSGKVYINGAEIVTTDIPASNGVIHAISAVILPPQ
jgi:uncharacterized surface protein with fasciclin (FAS1) repeats/nucleoid-associated protein YgaU